MNTDTLNTFLALENNNINIHCHPSTESTMGQHSKSLQCFVYIVCIVYKLYTSIEERAAAGDKAPLIKQQSTKPGWQVNGKHGKCNWFSFRLSRTVLTSIWGIILLLSTRIYHGWNLIFCRNVRTFVERRTLLMFREWRCLGTDNLMIHDPALDITEQGFSCNGILLVWSSKLGVSRAIICLFSFVF